MPSMHTITLLPGKLTCSNPSNKLSAGVLDKAYLAGFYHHVIGIFYDPITSIKAVIGIDEPNFLL
jgi:hypothetical protein